MNNLILIRHGQSLWNKERRFTGWADIDLTEEGKLEAKNAGKLIKQLNIEFDSYFTSQLKRAINTLKIILNVLNKQKSEVIVELLEAAVPIPITLNLDSIKVVGKENRSKSE